jgi:F-type H+-transporting ATPase subunit alpha
MEPIRANEISEIIRRQIENFDAGVTVTEVGTVIKIGDGIAEVHGLEKAMAGELLEFPHDVRGLALNLEEDKVGVVLFGEYQMVKEGDTVKRTGRIMSSPWARGSSAASSTRSACRLTSAAPSRPTSTTPLERIAPGVVDRQPVKEPLQTGSRRLTRWCQSGAASAS